MQRQQTGGRMKAIGFLVGALGVAGITSFLVWRVLQRYDQKVQEAQMGPEKVTVIVAQTDLFVGVEIVPEDLTAIEVLPETVPYLETIYRVVEEGSDQLANDNTFTSLEGFLDGSRTPKERIYAGEILREERLANPEEGIGLNALIAPNKRAMTIMTDAESSLAGLLQPNNYVDVIVTIRPDTDDKNVTWVTDTILQTIKVLAVNDSLDSRKPEEEVAKGRTKTRAQRSKPTVTLEVTPEEAEKLALASSRGDLHLVLRSDTDVRQQEIEGVLNTNELVGMAMNTVAQKGGSTRGGGARRGGTARATTPEIKAAHTAEIIEGGNRTIEKIDDKGERIPETSGRKRGQ